MRYVPSRSGEPPPSPTTPPAGAAAAGATAAVRQAVRELRTLAERRAWATRGPFRGPAPVPTPHAWFGEAGHPAPSGDVLADLHAATARYVRTLRDEGARPEQMLVRVKACVRDAMEAERWQDPDAVQALTAEVVGWSIAAYYDR